MNQQTEAQRLADALENPSIASNAFRHTVAAELRRLEAVNAQLLDALGWIAVVNAMDYEYQNKARTAIKAAKGEA